MKPRKHSDENQFDLFRIKIIDFIDEDHKLVKLSREINWQVFDDHFSEFFDDETGRPALSVRLIIGLLLLKYTFNFSDEYLAEHFLENPYWQYFCGFEYFQHELPFDRSSLSKWRKKIGADNFDTVLKELLDTAKRKNYLQKKDIENVVVDSTVQEKAITFPTDCKLYYKSIVKLVRLCQQVRLPLRQSFIRIGKRELIKYGRLSHSKKYKKANKCKRNLRTYLGRLIRDIERKLAKYPHLEYPELREILERAKRIYSQQKNDRNKLYSLHEPYVECISKGKSHKKYEFGNKVSIVTTASNCWIIGVESLHGNPYDGSTLDSSIDHVEKMTDYRPNDVYLDQGYRGARHHPSDINVHIVNAQFWRRRHKIKWGKRRTSVEPVIGHVKNDHRMTRNFLKGIEGDNTNAILACCGFNMRKLLRAIARFLYFFDKFHVPTSIFFRSEFIVGRRFSLIPLF